MRTSVRHTALALLAVLPMLAVAAGKDEAMTQLARNAGCLTCHQIEPGGKGPDGLPPIGPAWRDVAAKYKAQKGAAEQLTATVMGLQPYESH
jgi:cytochrome c